MEPKHLFTIKWTQPYPTIYERPYMRGLHEAFEQLVEYQLEDGDFTEANEIINQIKNL